MRRLVFGFFLIAVVSGCGASDISTKDVQSKEAQIRTATQHQPDVDFSGRAQGQ